MSRFKVEAVLMVKNRSRIHKKDPVQTIGEGKGPRSLYMSLIIALMLLLFSKLFPQASSMD